MTDRVLLALDGIGDATVTMAAAIDLARHGSRALDVLLTIDGAAVGAPEAHGAGGDAMMERRAKAILGRLEAGLARAGDQLAQRLTASGVEAAIERIDGDIAVRVSQRARAYDLVVLSHAARYATERDDLDASFAIPIRALIPLLGVPVLLLDVAPLTDGPVLVADDGGPAATRAVHAARRCGLLDGRACHLVHVAASVERARTAVGALDGYLTHHGLAAYIEALEGDDPSELVLARIETLRPALVVMGAFGDRSLRTWLFGSTTATLLDRCASPILLSA